MNVTTRLLRGGIILSGVFLATGFVMAQAGGSTEEPPQTPAAQLTADQLTVAAKRYFRDTAELPLVQLMEFSVLDSSGRVRKTQKLTLDYLFQGYSPRNETARVNLSGNVSFWSIMRGNKMIKASLNSASWTMNAGVVARHSNFYSFEASGAGTREGPILAKLVPTQPCPVFAMIKNAEIYMADDTNCGPMAFQLDRDLRFERFVYDASGVPAKAKIAPFGECTLRRYHTEIEFQTATIPGDNEPFVIPKRVTTTLETSKGKVVISSTFEPKPRSLVNESK